MSAISDLDCDVLILGAGLTGLTAARSLERQGLSVECFERYFGKRAARVEAYAEKVWTEDPWARGCYGTVLPPGVATDLGPRLQRRWGRVRFAGADLEGLWNGHMEGAVRSGERAARQISEASGRGGPAPTPTLQGRAGVGG
jgi:monoamine oxidase